MPAPEPSLTRAAAEQVVRDREFGETAHPDCDACGRNGIGIELEFLTDQLSAPGGTAQLDGGRGSGRERLRQSMADAIRRDLGRLPGGSLLTVEPGGQLELSTRPFITLDAACDAAAIDLYMLDQTCARHGVGLYALGQDPVREPERIVTEPRYRAMESFFDSVSLAGRTMMTNTASIQINVGLGDDPHETARRWHRANVVGPSLAACFANSPFALGTPTGWQSTRLRTWWQLDPSRSAPVQIDADGDAAAAWLDYALEARVMLVRTSPDDYVAVNEPIPFAQWMEEGMDEGYPTITDFQYHLTTLFPPVRPRGWFEVRYLDALPTPFWHVATAVIASLTTHPDLDGELHEAVDGTEDLWVDASQLGLAHPRLATSGFACFELAIAALSDLGASEATLEIVEAYRDRWVSRGRCPADDATDRWRRDGRLHPERESPVPYAAAPALTGADRNEDRS